MTDKHLQTLDDLPDVAGKVALVRVDLNAPMRDGHVADATRLKAIVPTVRDLIDRGAHVVLLSHFGRPKGKPSDDLSLRPLVPALENLLDSKVVFASELDPKALQGQPSGTVTLFENTRFHPGEEANTSELVDLWARAGELFVNDAFSAAHRAHASTLGLAERLPAYAGRAMERELAALDAALGSPEPPVAAVVGGAKISSKINVLNAMVAKVHHLIIGGAMANTFLAARGVDVGKSLCEHDLLEEARAILDVADEQNCTVHLPYDVVIAHELAPDVSTRVVNVHEVGADEMILDIGPAAVEALSDVLKNCRTLVWNGPLGAFETPPFDRATVALAETVAALTQEGSLLSVAGGGDTVAALNHAGVADRLSFVSTAGGAFLEWMEGRELPGVAPLYG